MYALEGILANTFRWVHVSTNMRVYNRHVDTISKAFIHGHLIRRANYLRNILYL